jgi:queuosine precursor transporter
MGSEIEFLALVIVELLALSFLARAGKEWLYLGVIVNLLLVSVLGAKTTEIFGFVTNSGNIFYAAATFALLLTAELFDGRTARRGLWFGVVGVVFFLVAAQLVIGAPGTPASREVDEAMRSLFVFVPRVTLASLVALIVSQNLSITFFVWLQRLTHKRWLGLRYLVAVGLAQLVDSLLFFAIAFAGTVPGPVLLQIMVTGLFVKIIFGLISTPFLYSTCYLRRTQSLV